MKLPGRIKSHMRPVGTRIAPEMFNVTEDSKKEEGYLTLS
jgi:hypothetical protein